MCNRTGNNVVPEQVYKAGAGSRTDQLYYGTGIYSEGAIPYAASDPLHVIPACVIGSGIAGAMSMAFKCTLMAPHGGIFVVPVIGNPWMYLIALVVGMAVSTVLLGVLKKKVR